MNNDVLKSYEVISRDGYHVTSRLSPAVPTTPDREYHVYSDENEHDSYVVVSTDHPDPAFESEEFRTLSGKFFKRIILPGNDGKTVTISESEETLDSFFIKDGGTYYYLAKI